jgi:hypothetical protein
MRIVKPLEDIKADFLIDGKDATARLWRWDDAKYALIGSFGYRDEEADRIISAWLVEEHAAKMEALHVKP